jgi:ssDNA-binding Zn-finger/Zn-ribbon topoisomerase 1
MQCPNCGSTMDFIEMRRNVLEFLGCVGCVSCLVWPVGCLLAPLAFFLPKDKYYLCPKCGHKEPAK